MESSLRKNNNNKNKNNNNNVGITLAPTRISHHNCDALNPDDDDDDDSLLLEKISTLLSRWSALQTAVRNCWGGHDSLQKSQQLVFDISFWFSQSKGPLHVEDLESFLYETLLLTFNTDIEDGSIEHIAEKLMIIHEECLQRSD